MLELDHATIRILAAMEREQREAAEQGERRAVSDDADATPRQRDGAPDRE